MADDYLDFGGKVPILPPGTKLTFIDGHAWPVETMADWTPGDPVSVAVAEANPRPRLWHYLGTSPRRTWAGAVMPDIQNLKRAMETPPDFFSGPLGVPYDGLRWGGVFDPKHYRKDYTLADIKTYRYADFAEAGFPASPEIEAIIRRAALEARRRQDARLIAHLIVKPPLSLGLIVYDLDTMKIFTNARSERDRITALGAISFRTAYVDETFEQAEIEEYWAEYIRNPPVDLADCDIVFHEDPPTLDYHRED